MATYRWIIDTDDFKLRGMLKPCGHLEVRESKRAARTAYTQFAVELAHKLPQTEKATARLEVTNRGHTRTLARYSGRVTEMRRGNGREMHCMYPSRGEWMLEEDDAVLEGISSERILAEEVAKRSRAAVQSVMMDRAGLFLSEETALDRLPSGTHARAAAYAEIATLARLILDSDESPPRTWALRLAAACRAAGLVKP